MNRGAAAAVVGFLLCTAVVRAESQYSFQGAIEAGYRFTNVAGRESRYRQEVNLYSGPRITSLEGEGRLGGANYSLHAESLGGDPFPSVDFSLKGSERYALTMYYRGSAYDDTTPGDNHAFSTELRRAGGSFVISPSARGDVLTFSFSRQQRVGGLLTTRTVDFDQFIASYPSAVDSKQNDFHLSYRRPFFRQWLVEVDAGRGSTRQSEKILAVGDIRPIPDTPPLTTPASIDLATRAYAMTSQSPEVSVRLQNGSAGRLNFSTAILAGRTDADYSLGIFESGKDRSTNPYQESDHLAGSGAMDYRVFDGSVRVRVSDRVSLVQSVRLDDRSQTLSGSEKGQFIFPPSQPIAFGGPADSGADFRMTTARGDIQIGIGSSRTLRAGYEYSKNAIDMTRDGKPYDANSSSAIRATLGLQQVRQGGFYEIAAAFGRASRTLTALSPRADYLIAAKARQRMRNDQISVTVDFRQSHFTNREQSLTDYASGSPYLTAAALQWSANTESRTTSFGVSLSYSPSKRLDASASYSFLDASSRGDILYYFNFVLQPSLAHYKESVHIMQANISGRPTRRLTATFGMVLEKASGTRDLNAERVTAELSTLVVKNLRAVTSASYQRLHEDSFYLASPLGSYEAISFFIGFRKDFH